MYITKLKNPKSPLYEDTKKFVLSNSFPWYWNHSSTPTLSRLKIKNHQDSTHFSHEFLRRPDVDDVEAKFPIILSDHAVKVSKVLEEILRANDIKVNCFIRICANCVFPTKKSINTIPHVDHNFPHNNIIVYLTNAGGSTVVQGEESEPIEDGAILFKGELHYLKTPKQTEISTRRVVLVATFI